MVKNCSVWGCDVCQNVCPYTKNAKYTPIKFFIDSAIDHLDSTTLKEMSPEEFQSRPFAWRGYDTIKRNVLIWEKAKKKEREEAEAHMKLVEAEERIKFETTLEIDAIKDIDKISLDGEANSEDAILDDEKFDIIDENE